MVKDFKKKFGFLIPIVVIIILMTIGYMLIYAHNPFMELGSAVKAIFTNNATRPAPELIGIQEWINSEPLNIKELNQQGKVVLIDFWTYACINCQRSIPFVLEWYEKYKDQGLVVIGVHTPEFRFEQNVETVKSEMAKYPVVYPVAIDNDYKTWRAFQNHYWPGKYLIDVHGNIVYTRFGEGGYDITEAKIVELLESAKALTDKAD